MPFQASALTSIFMATANEFPSSTPWWQQTWKENESALPHPGVPHPCPPTYAPNNTHSLPSGWGRGLRFAHRGTEQISHSNHCTKLLKKVLHSYMQAAGLFLTPWLSAQSYIQCQAQKASWTTSIQADSFLLHHRDALTQDCFISLYSLAGPKIH